MKKRQGKLSLEVLLEKHARIHSLSNLTRKDYLHRYQLQSTVLRGRKMFPNMWHYLWAVNLSWFIIVNSFPLIDALNLIFLQILTSLSKTILFLKIFHILGIFYGNHRFLHIYFLQYTKKVEFITSEKCKGSKTFFWKM